MLADGQDLVGSYIILHVTGECSVERGSVLYIHTHPCDYGCCPPTQYTTWSSLVLSISTIYDIILFGHTSPHNNTVHQVLMCLVTHCRSQTAADSQVFKDDIFIYDVCYLCS